MAKDKSKKEKKEKKEKKPVEVTEDTTKEEGTEKVYALSAIAHPLANKKLTKKLLKTVKKATKQKYVKRGVKEVVKGLRKGEKGLVIIAGDISPIDVITHVPVMCEEADVPYCYVPSKEELGTAGSTKRPTSVVMIVSGKVEKDDDIKETYIECMDEVKKMDTKVVALA
ncbi:50S ribosomal protein L30e-like protein [Paraphysoderma sedebokerense]|nr:50S ribosomal protein L30e-like protein [Paraphysoderma sedebokerense]